jgi:hypothetical protein
MIEKEQMIDTIPDSLLRPGVDDPSRCAGGHRARSCGDGRQADLGCLQGYLFECAMLLLQRGSGWPRLLLCPALVRRQLQPPTKPPAVSLIAAACLLPPLRPAPSLQHARPL